MSRKRDQQIEWRRDEVKELASKGWSHRRIASELHVSKTTVTDDLDYLRMQTKENIRTHVEERLPEVYDRCIVGVNAILEEAWDSVQEAKEKGDRPGKHHFLSLAKECYAMLMDLVDTGTVVEKALRFVEHNNGHANAKDKPLLLIAQKDEVRIDDDATNHE